MAVGLSSPLPCPQPRDRRAARARGTRGSLRRTLVARPALAVAISAPSLLTRSWAKAARTENAAKTQGRSTGQMTRRCARDFPSLRTGYISPLSWAVRIRRELTLGSRGPSKLRDGAAENCKPTMPPQADRLSRFLALIWAMRMGPSENSPSPAFRVSSRK